MNQLSKIIQSILFVSGKEVEESYIMEKLNITKQEFNQAVSELMSEYSNDMGIHVLRFNKKLQFASNPAYAKQVESVLNPIKEKELTNALLESLAIIAYKQPITRIEIEELRGVDSTYSIQMLLKFNLIEPVGRKETIGKPILFGTTDQFLKRFGLTDVSDLPDYDEFIDKLQSLANSTQEVEIIEKPMFSNVETEDIPDFLKEEEVVVVD